MAKADTIAAVATATGIGGIGIVRVSGPKASGIANALLSKTPKPRTATYAKFKNRAGHTLDIGLALYFPAPNSFTGEDVLELHGHGGPVVLDLVLGEVVAQGARLARPGEFSERAFLNGKLDLVQAEAIADLIEAGTRAAAQGALRSLEGGFSKRVYVLVEALIRLRLFVEAAIDFPEEEIDFLSDPRVLTELATLEKEFETLLASTQHGVLLHDGYTVVLAGPPNAGKSSLLNALAQSERAIVSDIPGTTRDVLRERLALDGMPLHAIDTAGLRETCDVIESEGVRRARAELSRADRALFIIDAAHHDENAIGAALAHVPTSLPRTLIRNKIDLTRQKSGMKQTEQGVEISLSVKTGEGLDLLRQHLKQCAGLQPVGEGGFTARQRHLDALTRAQKHLHLGRKRLQDENAGELLAEELHQAQRALNEITGEFTPDDLLGRIFSSFCIGK